jgi:formylglycine-generating enzyme required for sulfatase activity
MKCCGIMFVTCGLAFFACGCNPDKKPSDPAKAPTERETDGLQAKDLVGKWRLVRAGGQPPLELYIKSQEIDIAADGTWTSKVEMQPPGRTSDSFHGKGTWALADGNLNWRYTAEGGVIVRVSGPDSGKSSVRLESGRLSVDPDFFMQARKTGTDPVAGEYERPSSFPKEKQDLIVAMKFVKVPRGTFWMGWDSVNKQSKQVEIKQDFELAAYTVTQGQWQELVGNNPSEFSRNEPNSNGFVRGDDKDLQHFPVENVSWNDVQEFLKKLNEHEKGKGRLYRLPTEAEWEYACRGAATSKEECSFDFYLDRPTNELSPKFANFNGTNTTVKVGSYEPNKLGLYDMYGNVSQWCDDLARAGGTARVVRGGNWAWSAVRTASRTQTGPDKRLNYCGFRVARVPSGSE